jgi:hypothetical protein
MSCHSIKRITEHHHNNANIMLTTDRNRGNSRFVSLTFLTSFTLFALICASCSFGRWSSATDQLFALVRLTRRFGHISFSACSDTYLLESRPRTPDMTLQQQPSRLLASTVHNRRRRFRPCLFLCRSALTADHRKPVQGDTRRFIQRNLPQPFALFEMFDHHHQQHHRHHRCHRGDAFNNIVIARNQNKQSTAHCVPMLECVPQCASLERRRRFGLTTRAQNKKPRKNTLNLSSLFGRIRVIHVS